MVALEAAGVHYTHLWWEQRHAESEIRSIFRFLFGPLENKPNAVNSIA